MLAQRHAERRHVARGGDWPVSGRPLALRKTVPFMPSSRALAVIMRAKCASRAAEQFAERGRGVVGRLGDQRQDAVSTVIVPPGLTPSFVGGSAAACAENGSACSLILPPRRASKSM